MITFLNIPKSKNDWENTRINMEHVVSYEYVPEYISSNGNQSTVVPANITLKLYNGTSYCMGLENLDPKKIIKRLDALSKVVKLEIK